MSHLLAGIPAVDPGLEFDDYALFWYPLILLMGCALLCWIVRLIDVRLERKRREQESAGQDLRS